MVKMSVKLLAVLSLMVPAFANSANLVNKDDQAYNVYVDTDDQSVTVTIGPNETITDICDECYIEIDGNPDDLLFSF